jgi:glutaredoxin
MRTPDFATVVAFCLAALAAPAAAQFKWIAPDGAITYSDQPPPPGMKGQMIGRPIARADNPGTSSLLRDAASKYPVTLYSTDDCGPCQDARRHLTKRGVPFSEKTVTTTADTAAFRKAGFTENSFPALSVGRERTLGFEPEGWNRLLDVAGYPRSSTMPASWRPPAPQPMAGAPKPAEGATSSGGTEAVADAQPRAARTRARAETGALPAPGANPPNTVRF